MSKQSVHHITDTLTADAMCQRLGVGEHSIRGARTKGVFPAAWYAELRRMCDEAGIACPLSAFSWRMSADYAKEAAPSDRVAAS